MSGPTDKSLLGLVVAGLFLYLAADLTSQSIALDGAIYGNIARLLASGEGSFWQLPYFDTGAPVFYDHPPLGVYLLSRWIDVFGDQFWSDKLFAATNVMVTVAMLGALLRAAGSQVPLWWVLVALFVMPITSYVLKNNHLESLLGIATITAVACGWLAWRQLGFAVGLGLLVLIAVLIKGPVGLFPLAALPAAQWWYHREFLRPFKIGAVATATFGTAVALVYFLVPESAAFVDHYWVQQLRASVTGERIAEHGRGYILWQLSSNLLAGAVVLGLLSRNWVKNRITVFWLIIGLIAAIPLLLSPRQYKHYLLPALPFFALSLASAFKPVSLRVSTSTVWFGTVVLIMSCIAAAYVTWGRAGDHAEDIADAATVAAAVPGSVSYCPDDRSLRLRAYLFRYHGVRTHEWRPPDYSDWVICDGKPSAGAVAVHTLNSRLTLWRDAES